MSSFLIDGVEIHYELAGAGEPVALLNGIMMTVASWAFQRKALEPRYRLLLHDMRGQALSGKPDEDWDIERHAHDLRALLDHVGIERCHVVGTSYGGEVGLIFAAHFPERVRSLTVIASVAHVEPRLRLQTDLWAEAALRDPRWAFRTVAVDTFSGRYLAQNPGLLEAGEVRLAENPPDFLPAFARLVRAFQKLDARPLLARIASPTLVVSAEHDSLKPCHYGREIADGIQGAELVVVPDAGHAVVLEKPDVVNTLLLGFLAKHALRDTPRGALP
jgi:3-oxoadipate enol-lactonase